MSSFLVTMNHTWLPSPDLVGPWMLLSEGPLYDFDPGPTKTLVNVCNHSLETLTMSRENCFISLVVSFILDPRTLCFWKMLEFIVVRVREQHPARHTESPSKIIIFLCLKSRCYFTKWLHYYFKIKTELNIATIWTSLCVKLRIFTRDSQFFLGCFGNSLQGKKQHGSLDGRH